MLCGRVVTQLTDADNLAGGVPGRHIGGDGIRISDSGVLVAYRFVERGRVGRTWRVGRGTKWAANFASSVLPSADATEGTIYVSTEGVVECTTAFAGG
ncbi:hypothetical protein GW17_00025341 [Ensete ventricosum]|uniref:Uncharacterized protein n=1 Tax=Ensete ventricosum TaxID=4639 RepID=A0A444EL32_ENSVE|nr:hypothetical protein GW17_00025341 [Ensete ventricosum]RZR75250.1 hypothetical protein BHM03_00052667 [Ensete ventricosum]